MTAPFSPDRSFRSFHFPVPPPFEAAALRAGRGVGDLRRSFWQVLGSLLVIVAGVVLAMSSKPTPVPARAVN
jgi:hypothetical protein